MPRKKTGRPGGRPRKQPSDYPAVLQQTLLRLLSGPDTSFVVECSTPAHLKALRFQAYMYFGALREHRDDDAMCRVLVEVANNSWIRVEPPNLIIEKSPFGSYDRARQAAELNGMILQPELAADHAAADRMMTPEELRAAYAKMTGGTK